MKHTAFTSNRLAAYKRRRKIAEPWNAREFKGKSSYTRVGQTTSFKESCIISSGQQNEFPRDNEKEGRVSSIFCKENPIVIRESGDYPLITQCKGFL